jgi:hypothetical protein
VEAKPIHEEALILKDFGDGRVLIERANGERWILDAKTSWCEWSWHYEERKVLLQFGPFSSTLINDKGEACDFWTEEQIF